jgi:UbiD family decarboxylase
MTSTGPFVDLRGYADALEERGLLCRVTAPVSADGEVGAIQRVLFDRSGPGVRFDDVDGSGVPLVPGLMATPERYALGIGCEPTMRAIIRRVLAAAQGPIPPVLVDRAPAQENVLRGGDIDLDALPVPRWHEQDGGRYLGTLGLVIMKDPDTGARNVGIYRQQIHSKDTLLLNATQQAGILLTKYKRLGRPMPIATVVGVDPCTLAASCIQARLGDDEFGMAGNLLGAPLEMVKCVTQDLEVPATAEFVFEGEIDPNGELIHEGPFGEYTGYYGLSTQAPQMKLTAVTHRDDPIFQGTLEGAPPSESTMLRLPGNVAGMWMRLGAAMKTPGIKDLYMTDMSCVSYMAIVALEKQYYFGHARQIMETIWASIPGAKWVVVVNDDVDIYDRGQVEWAMATRVQPHRDIWVTPQNQPGINLDPAIHPDDRVYPNVRTSRVGIDATVDFKGYQFEPLARPGRQLTEQVLARWSELGLPG